MMKWIRDNDIFLRVGSLLIAILLWAYAMSNDQSDMKQPFRDLPVQLEGVNILKEQNLVILSGANNQVDVELTGKRDQLQYVMNDPLTTLHVTSSVANITEPGTYTLGIQAAPVGIDATVSSKDPTNITVVVDKLSDTAVPVELDIVGELPAGLTLAEVSASPDAIAVRGPETVLRQIKKAKVTYDISGLTSALQTNVTYTLLDENGQQVTNQYLTTDTPSTMLHIDLRQEGSIPLGVGLTDSPYLKEYNVTVNIAPSHIKLKGDPEVIESINQVLLDDIDLNEVVEKKTLNFTRLLMLPDGTTLVPGQKQFATVTLQLDDHEWKTLTLDQDDLPADPLFTYPEQTFELELFGEKDVLRRIRTSDLMLSLSYDLEELVVGENVVPCRVVLEENGVYLDRGGLDVRVEVTQEALDAVLTPQPVDPNDPNAPQEPQDPED